ncbi:MAG TPA: hypothetical protein V6C88_03645 [Chroococcidiopsis sp.]
MPSLSFTIKQQCLKFKRGVGVLVQTNLYLGLLWLAYGGVGWLLCAYRSSIMVWLGTLVMTLYLVWVGVNAIALASIWVVAVLSLSAIRHAWLWRIPRPSYYGVEPFTLLVIWLLALGLVVLTAMMHQQLRQRCDRLQTFVRMIVPIGIGVVCGVVLYYQWTFPRLSP